MAFTTSTTLSVSSKKPMDCKKMAEFLGAKGFYSSVTSNISTEPHIEYGCRLTQSMTEKKEMELIQKLGLPAVPTETGKAEDLEKIYRIKVFVILCDILVIE